MRIPCLIGLQLVLSAGLLCASGQRNEQTTHEPWRVTLEPWRGGASDPERVLNEAAAQFEDEAEFVIVDKDGELLVMVRDRSISHRGALGQGTPFSSDQLGGRRPPFGVYYELKVSLVGHTLKGTLTGDSDIPKMLRKWCKKHRDELSAIRSQSP